jgi:Uma2 family endonuclease
MSALGHKLFITPEEYLAGERISPIKHEYINGRIFAMAGASKPHVTIADNALTLLRPIARARGCQAFSSDMKVRIETTNRFYYPDITVTCDERDRNRADFNRFPSLIVEVLSESTEGFDRGDKFLDYLELKSLREYVLISQNQMKIEVRRPIDSKHWTSEIFLPGDLLELESLDFRCPVERLYDDVIWEDPEEAGNTEGLDATEAPDTLTEPTA